jgi:dipeptidyl aminopeptidase/acylaminoacyl peptidase
LDAPAVSSTTITLSLPALLEARSAAPADVSPDGQTVLVLSNLSGTMQAYRLPATGGELVQLTDFEDAVASARFLEDGRVLVQKDEGGNERYQLYLVHPAGSTPPEPLVYEPEFMHLDPQQSRDGSLLAYACNRRNGEDFDVFVRDLQTGDERTVFAPGGMTVPTGFSPDGRWLSTERLTERPADNDVHLVDVRNGEVVHATAHEDEALFDRPAWLSDGSAFFFATNSGRDFTGIARYDLASRSWRYVHEAEWDLSCSIDRAGRTLLVELNEDGYTRLELRDPETLDLRRDVPLARRGMVPLARPAVSPRIARDGSFVVYHVSSPVEPGDTWRFDVHTGETIRLTRSPIDVPLGELVEPELHRFTSFDGEQVPVFLWLPRRRDLPAPVLVAVHGGPEAQFRPTWRDGALIQYLVARGFAVAAPNVRGSTGYGKRYEHLDDVHLRLDSVRDLAALHGWLAARPEIDGNRAALYGVSYGGYMVLAALAFQPERWSAGIEVVGISSFVTFLENTAQWRRYYREREYGSLQRDRDFLEQASPLTHVDRIRAPLFIIHGANDPRVPLSEAQQIHRVLTEKDISCELLVYPDEGHGLLKLANRLDAYPRAAAFLERVLAR